MGEPAIGADSQEFCAQGLEFRILGGNCRYFGGSNKGKIAGIKAQHQPFPLKIRQLDILKTLFDKGRGLEVRGRFTDFRSHLLLLSGK